MNKNNILPLAGLPLLALVMGFFTYSSGHTPRVESVLLFTHVALSIALVFLWYWRDATERRYKPSIFLGVVMVGLTMLALPYYLFRSRSFLGGLKGVFFSLLIFASIVALYRVGALLA